MGQFLRALFVTSVATGAALVVISAIRKAGREREDSDRIESPTTAEIEADELPERVRQELIAELDGHV